MVVTSLLGIFLHARINRSMNLQTVCINLVIGPVFFLILITPSIKRVILPIQTVNKELNLSPRRIVHPVWFFSHHIQTKEISEINSNTILMVSRMELQRQGLILNGSALFLREISRFFHLRQHHITTVTAALRESDRVEIRWILT